MEQHPVTAEYTFHVPPTPNFEIELGSNTSVRFSFNEKRTLPKRLKWWLFTRFFPFKIVRWDKE